MTKLEQSDGAAINQNIPGPTDLNYLRFAKSSFANKKMKFLTCILSTISMILLLDSKCCRKRFEDPRCDPQTW